MELYLDHIYYEATMNGICLISSKNYNNIKNDAYGEYLLAKYEMIRCIVMDNEYKYFENGVSLMKDSANKGNIDAQEFLNQTKIMEIGYER